MAEALCAQCGKQYSRSPSLLGKYCSRECGVIGNRKVRTSHRRMRRLPAHPLAPASGLVSAARVALYDQIGPGPHPCHWCGKPVDWVIGVKGNLADSLVADHVNSDELDDSPENVVASCGTCNVTRAVARVGDDERYVLRTDGSRLRVGEERICDTCGDGFLTTRAERRRCQRCRRTPRPK